jgi:CDP-glucose 4,6-dehydratase
VPDTRPQSQLQPHEATLLHLDCRKARARLGWRSVWDARTTFERTAHWYRRHHEHGDVCSHDDLHRYIADARAAGIAWAVPITVPREAADA